MAIGPESLRLLVAENPTLRPVLESLLDRREADGRLPSRLTVAAPIDCLPALRTLLSARAVSPQKSGRVRLDLLRAAEAMKSQGPLQLDELLYLVLERTPRDPRREAARFQAELDAALARLVSECRTETSRRFLDDECARAGAGAGESWAQAQRDGVDSAAAETRRLILCIDAALVNASPIRIQNFAARVLLDSKALPRGSDRLRRLRTALLDHDPFTRREVDYLGNQPPPRVAQRLALEVHDVFRDESAVSVLCFGPFIFKKGAERFDYVGRHCALGEPVRLTLKQLRDATMIDSPLSRVTVLENLTPFLDYVEWRIARPPLDELVVLSEGQASSAVIALLKLATRREVPIRHAGDLDRSGVLIWRSLMHRVRTPIAPWGMSVERHRAHVSQGRPLAAEERERLTKLLAEDDPAAPGHDLLREIARTDRWIEQEVLLPDLLA